LEALKLARATIAALQAEKDAAEARAASLAVQVRGLKDEVIMLRDYGCCLRCLGEPRPKDKQ